METARFHEALGQDVMIISEGVSEQERSLMEVYDGLVRFVDPVRYSMDNIESLSKAIKSTLEEWEADHSDPKQTKQKWRRTRVMDLYNEIYEANRLALRDIFFFLRPYLFHKYMLGLADPKADIQYQVRNALSLPILKGGLFAHLHCYDISKFREIYGNYIETIYNYFSVVVTYSLGIARNVMNKQIALLKIPNKGMDIGAKFCMVQYLKNQKIDYSYILFLHSKSNPKARKNYFAPLISRFKEEETALEFIENINDYDGYFPNIQWEIQGDRLRMITGNPQFANCDWPERNLQYRKDLLSYLGCENQTNRFVEGNVYLLSKKVVERIFGDKRLYNILNGSTDFDYNWICARYGLSGSLRKVYDEFRVRQLQPRDKLSYDGYIEHTFERVVLNCIDERKIKFINPPKVCIIYVYYERKNEQKNQTNLSFFIKYGLDKSRWRNMDITTLFVINGHQYEVLIPETEDIFILKEANCSDWEGWYNGIKYFENKYKEPIYESFSHLCLINASSFGPVYEDGKDRHWLDPFLNKMSMESSIACSPCINYLQNTDAGGPGPRLVPHFSLIRIDKTILRLLTQTLIYPTAKDSIQKKYINYPKNTILGKKKDKIDAILTGEYGLSRVLLKYNFNISCLVIYTDKAVKLHIDKIYKEESNKDIIFRQIFVKNVWRGNKQIRYSLPYFYNDIYTYINSTLNYKNVFRTKHHDYNYELLDINEFGQLVDTNDRLVPKYKWDTKKDFYNLYGYSEEFVLWPKIIKKNKSVVIYCHYDEDNIIKDYVITGLKTLIILEYDIIFCTTCSKIRNIDLPFKVNYFQNKKNIRAGNDIFMMRDILSSEKINNYEWILCMNDSILMPIIDISVIKNIINKYRDNDFWGIYLSNENKIHLCSCFIEFNRKCIGDLLIFYNKFLGSCKNTKTIVSNIECNLTEYLFNKGYKFDGIVSYKKMALCKCLMFNPINIYKYLQDPHNSNVFGIKWKYIGNYINYNKLSNHYLNYLMRYIKLGDKIPNIPNHFG